MNRLNLNKKRIIALGLSAITLTSASGLIGCNNTNDQDSTLDTSISDNLDNSSDNGVIEDYNNIDSNSNYCLIDFGDTLKVIKYQHYTRSNSAFVNIYLDDNDIITIGTSNVLFFDINSKEQVNLVNEILMNNEKETIPYVKVR